MLRRLLTVLTLSAALGLVSACGSEEDQESAGDTTATETTATAPATGEEDTAGEDAADGSIAEDPSPVTRQELGDMLAQANEEIGQAIGEVEQAADADEFRAALEDAAEVEQRQIERLENVEPPRAAERAVDELLEGARAQAERFRELAEQEDLSLDALRAEFREDGAGDRQVDRAFDLLERAGVPMG